jgi:glutamate dehydrogenase/leucine dehydrogenase
VALEVAQEFCALRLDQAQIVVQGFGSVGQHAARCLAAHGARVVGVSDSGGARVAADGFELSRLLEHKQSGASVVDFDEGLAINPADLIAVSCDVWIPAARPDVITEENVGRMQTRVVVQGANIPASAAAERALAERGVLVIPDFVANAGGVICAAVEYHDGSEAQAVATIREKIAANVHEVLTRSSAEARLPRDVANTIARERVLRAMRFRHTH